MSAIFNGAEQQIKVKSVFKAHTFSRCFLLGKDMGRLTERGKAVEAHRTLCFLRKTGNYSSITQIRQKNSHQFQTDNSIKYIYIF